MQMDNAFSEILNTQGMATQAGRMPARDRRTLLYIISLGLDCTALVVGFLLAANLKTAGSLSAGGQPLVLVALPIFVMFAIAREAQSAEALASRSLGLTRALGALGATALTLILLTFFLKETAISRLGFMLFFVFSVIGLAIARLILDMLVRAMLGGKTTADLLVIDGGEGKPEPGMDWVDVGRHGLWPDLSRPDKIDMLSRIVASYDRVVVACEQDHCDAWAKFLRGSDVGGEILVDRTMLLGAVAIGECNGNDTLILSRGPLSLISRFQKRFVDLALAVPLVIVLSPLLGLFAVLIRLDSPGPAIFSQIRVGQGSRQFRMFKFRSMRQETSDGQGSRSTARNDDRITRIGRFIRATSIDELPQIFNVLKGDMSLVGPRPHALGSLAGEALFWEVSDNYWLRHALKPGMTGLAQVRGFRGATLREEDLKQRLRCDLEYVANWSVWLDVTILIKTIRVVMHKNAF